MVLKYKYQEPPTIEDAHKVSETLLFITELAQEIDAALVGLVEQPVDNIWPDAAESRKLLRRGDAIFTPTVGEKVILAYAAECINRHCKFSIGYNNDRYCHGAYQELKKYLKPEVLKRFPDDAAVLNHFFYEAMAFPFSEVSLAIKNIANRTDGWSILFVKLKTGILVIEDCGDYRVHQWEATMGTEFRSQRKLLPARGIYGRTYTADDITNGLL